MIPLALKQASNQVLGTVTHSAVGVSHAVASISHLAAAGEAIALDYRTGIERDLAENQTRRHSRRMHERALSDATFFLDLETTMKGNDRLTALYQDALNDYSKADADVVARLQTVPAE